MAKVEYEAAAVASSDEEDADEGVVELNAIPGDLYGATLVSTVLAVDQKKWGDFIIALFRQLVNIFLQLGVTYAVWKYVNKDHMSAFFPAESRSEVYTARLNWILDNPLNASAHLNPATSITDRTVISLCNSLPHGHFLLVVWFLWSAKIVTELTSSFQLATQVFRVPVHSRVHLTEPSEGDAVNIMTLTFALKVLFVVLLVAPKFLISFLLWFVGTEFLALARDMGCLILKVFTLQFVLTLDELLFEAFLASSNKARIKSCKINDYKGTTTAWLVELTKFMICVVLTLFAHFYFEDIQEVRKWCWRCVRDCDSRCSAAFDYCGMSQVL